MKINNIDAIRNKIKCDKLVADYLISKGFSPIANFNGTYYFARTLDIIKICESLPFHLKIFGKVVQL